MDHGINAVIKLAPSILALIREDVSYVTIGEFRRFVLLLEQDLGGQGEEKHLLYQWRAYRGHQSVRLQ